MSLVQPSLKRPELQSEPLPVWTRSDWTYVLLIVAICGLAMLLRWKKMDSLVQGDPAWWLHQSFRVARGEFPYRDFAWQYPPFGLIAGIALRWFGVSFNVAQITIDLISLPVVLLSYVFLRYLIPGFLSFMTCLLLIWLCATARTFFALFSLLTYTPSLALAASGLLLFLIGTQRYLRSGEFNKTNLLFMGLGCFIGMGSKQEAFAAIAASLVVLAIADRGLWFRNLPFSAWFRRYLFLALVCVAPAAVMNALLIAKVGAPDFLAAMSGYGLATMACPWWPTGLGVFGMLAALGTAALIAATVSLARRAEYIAKLGARRYFWLWLSAGIGLLVWLSYEWYLAQPVLARSLGAGRKLMILLPSMAGSSNLLRPVMWVSIFYWLYLLYACWRDGSGAAGYRDRVTLLVVFATPLAMCTRSLFGSTILPYPEVPAICYPFFLILGSYLLVRFLEYPVAAARVFVSPDRVTTFAAAGVLVFLTLMRIAGGYPTLLSNRPYTALSTTAGSIFLSDYDVNAEIYSYIMSHTAASDTILDGPYGGGMHFATGRSSPTHSMLFRMIPTSRKYLDLDIAGVLRDPPKVAVFDNDTDFGIVWGIPFNVGCSCPRLVWVPDKPSSKPDAMPIADYLKRNYRIEKVVGQKVILVTR